MVRFVYLVRTTWHWVCFCSHGKLRKSSFLMLVLSPTTMMRASESEFINDRSDEKWTSAALETDVGQLGRRN